MEIIDRMLLCLNSQGKKMSELCSFLGIRTSTMATWKTRKTDPPAKYIHRICEFLSVSTNWLLTGEESETELSCKQATYKYSEYKLIGELSEPEITLVKSYREMSDNSKGFILGQATLLAAQDSSKVTKDNTLSTSLLGSSNIDQSNVG